MADVSFLRSVSLFSELQDSDLKKIGSILATKSLNRNVTVLIEEDTGSTMFIILKGSIKITRISEEGREVILSILNEGDFFGEMSILDDAPRSANAVTLEKSQLLVIHRKDFFQMLSDYPQITINMLKEFAHRLRRGDSQIKSLSLQDAVSKVASTIIRIADDSGTIYQGQVAISNLPPQQDLASMAGTSRETISRAIGSLTKFGYLKKEGGRLIILDYDKFLSDFS
jgi:CRP-like cAMP-binding protein